MIASLHNIVLTTVAFIAAMSIISCSTGSADSIEPRNLSTQRPYYDFQYDLDQLTIGIRLFHPDYAISPKVDIYEGTTLCDSQVLTTQTGTLTFHNNSTCRDFTINLLHVPATDACQPGGLYLMTGTVTNPAEGQTTNYNNMMLAAWDQNYNKVVPWFTPFDEPNLLSQMSKSDYVQSSPLSTVGQWTYQLDYASSVIPPDGCALQTNFDLSSSPADESLGKRVYNYTISETNVGGQITTSVTPNTTGAPTASVARDGTTRHLTFAGLDVLREANMQTSMAFRSQQAQVNPATVTFTPLRPDVKIESELFLDSQNGFPVGSLASHVASFFSTITMPLMGSYDPLPTEPHVNVKIGVSLATPLSTQNPITYVVTPITLIPNYTFRPGFDDRTDCLALPDPGLSCMLDSIITNYNATNGAPDSAALYTLDITLYSRIDGVFFPAIEMPKVVIRVSEIN